MPTSAAVVAMLCACALPLVLARPTIYVKNENDKLEPVLVPVSSTVIPLPVYRVAYGLGVTGAGGATAKKRPPGEHKLITASKKKGAVKTSEKEDAKKEKYQQ